jgi:hypothetical protein
LHLPLARIPNIPGGAGNTTRFLHRFAFRFIDCSFKIYRLKPDGPIEVRDLILVPLLVAAEESPRALSATLRLAMMYLLAPPWSS